ncbi:hypothetical protein LY76DRAFT_594941 [Colletotrichum caudatum]|nr:hypothetical protein LY76DRAFT_594941 [Colletotrichum caudatum]
MSSAQKVPAWKRLGLKLKQPASGAEIGGPVPAEGSKPNGQRLHDRHASGPVANAANASPAAAAAAKRKRLDQQAPPASSSPFKRTRTDDSSGHATPTLRKQKSVTFADDVKNPTAAEPKRKSKGPKKAAKTATQQPTADIKPSLEYLRNWKSSRDTWKFNKNHQTILMKRVFHADAIPSSDIATFYDYIQDLKGFTRTRLKETAAEVKTEDAEKGKAAFPEGTPDMDSKQSEYEKVLAGLMQLGSGSGPGSKRKRFDEPGFLSQSTDVAITQRVIKRMRAETILEELSDNDDSDAMTVDTEEAAPAAQEAETVDKRVKLNDGTKQPAARRRKRRTNVDSSSESSDSESESESESDSDSDSDSDDSDNASEIQRQAAQREAETTSEESSSSESSSSSSEDEGSSEDDSEEEEGTTKRKGSKK